ncbi:MAG: alpha/beta fold hydrolase [Nitrososphaerales archaeon]
MGFPHFWRAFTPRIRDELGKVPPDSIASLEMADIGGTPQCVLIRGRSIKNPVVLFLHGGPGMPCMYLAHEFQRPLERDFVVVQWDRRGAGKTYRKDTPPRLMSVTQEVADTVELVNQIRSRLGHPKVYLVGHSYGTYLGMIVAQRFPELFHAYVGVGQLAYSEKRNREVQDRWIRNQAKARGDRSLLSQLDAKVPIDRERWLFRFGGALRGKKSFASLLLIGLRAPEYSLMDALKVRKGVDFTSRNMKYDAIDGDLIDAVQRLDVPAYFFTGRHDYTDPFEYTEEYGQRLQAPKKEVVWFEESAHFPFLEEPGKFASEMRRVATESLS